MTEERFYYNTFYFRDDSDGSKEFEIRDKENDEWAIYIGENDSNWEDMLVELLNEQDKENQLLRKEINELYKLCDESGVMYHIGDELEEVLDDD